MRLRTALGTAALSLFLAGAASAQSLSVKPGKWETATTFNGTIEAEGMSMELPGKTAKTTQCIDEDDATFKPEQMAGDDCTATNVQSTSRSISFDIACNQQGASMTGSMEATASSDGTKVYGTMSMQGSHAGAGSLDMQGDFSGQRLGPCS